MTDADALQQARMSLAQAVTRSYAADRRAVNEHRRAAELRLRRAGREELGARVDHDLDADSADARANCREVMSLIDAGLAFDAVRYESAATGWTP